MNMFITQAMAITTLTKILVDMVKMAAPDAPKWVFPALALLFSVLIGVLMLGASGVPLNSENVSQAILSAILAAGAAIGVTELQKKVQ